jgi:hypothetical protein
MRFRKEGEIGIQGCLTPRLDWVRLFFSRVYLDSIPIPVFVKGIVV